MEDNELRKLLQELHDEIEHIDSVDEKGRQLLSEDEAVAPHPTLTQGIENSVDYFEVTHPTLTAALSKLLAILSNAGI
jgi:hypothetical protein